jgi:catechol 2,3-dioxygenase-like lactoylglutathione lyase family enzyme
MKRITPFFAMLLFSATAIAKDQPFRPHITGIAYVRLLATDAERSRTFYSTVLGIGPGLKRCSKSERPCFSLGQVQQIELQQATAQAEPNLLLELAFETANALELRRYLLANGTEATELSQSPDGSQYFEVRDPEGHRIVFIQSFETANWMAMVNQVSTHMIHAGFVVHDRGAEDRFYKDILGFHVYWHGGRTENETSWVDMQVPDGTDWLEYMLNVPANASHKTLGVMNHIALGVPDIHAAQQQLIKNGWKQTEEPKIGRDGKWQLNLYDPDETRVELMEFKPTKEPCCSSYTGPHPGPRQ